MIVNGGSHAQIAADEVGFFALLPPPLPPGSHEVVLEATQPDGTRLRSRENVKIVTDGNRTTKPLVVVSTSSAPVVQLSSPGSQPPASHITAGQQAMADASGSTRAAMVPEVSTVIVSRRENLWRISERMYGAGHRYKAIYQANQEQIRTPHVIYPGQTFIVPLDPAVRR
jgi:nucleoid-associated protein YgaU